MRSTTWLTYNPLFFILPAFLLACAARADGQDQESSSGPNILFAIADDWSYGHAGAYGCTWVETPSFDRIAREGLLFTRAYTPNAKCAPSRACLLTGRNSWQLKQACNHICFYPPEFTSYMEALGRHGYFVGYTGKGWGPGVAKDAAGKTRQMTGRPFNQRRAKPEAKGISPNDYSGNFEAFLDAAPEDEPWCFWYGTLEPHRGYEFGVGSKLAGKKQDQLEHVPAFFPDNETVRQDLLDYAYEVEHFDKHLGRILALLEARGELDNTIVVATSDHGMPFPRCKGQAYDYSNHVPLAIRWGKGIQAPGRRIDDYVSFIDLAPTYLEAARLDWAQAGMQPTSGRSLNNLFASTKSGAVDPERAFVLIGKERHDIGRPEDQGYPIRGIVQDDFLFVHNYETDRWPAGNPETGYLNCDGSPTKTTILDGFSNSGSRKFWEMCFGKRPELELYNLKSDPDCIQNLATEPQFRPRLQSMSSLMEAQLRKQQDPRIVADGKIFENYQYSAASTRGFYERHLKGEKVAAGWVNKSDFRPEQAK